jgi:hypothetical protein
MKYISERKGRHFFRWQQTFPLLFSDKFHN